MGCQAEQLDARVLQAAADDLPTQHTASAHDVNLPTALHLAAEVGLKMPGDIEIFAVEAEKVLEFDEHCTPAVAACLPRVVETVLAAIGQMD